MGHLYEVGTGVWQPDPNEGWVASQVVKKVVEGEKVKLVCRLENDEVSWRQSSLSNPPKRKEVPNTGRNQPAVPLIDKFIVFASSMKTRTVETTLAALEDGNNTTVPPLMNPSMLEATDDLTNLSHLNEPAGAC
jgi:myosin-5